MSKPKNKSRTNQSNQSLSQEWTIEQQQKKNTIDYDSFE